jgi:hypothetical protein
MKSATRRYDRKKNKQTRILDPPVPVPPIRERLRFNSFAARRESSQSGKLDQEGGQASGGLCVARRPLRRAAITINRPHCTRNRTGAVQGLLLLHSWSSHADFGSEWQIEVGHGKKAIVIFVPVPLLQGFHRVQQR